MKKDALDRAALQSPLGLDGREACLEAIKQGSPAQAVRACAILAGAGEPVTLPATVRSAGWPDLPKRDSEVRSLFRIAQREPDYFRSFVVALLARKGPSKKIRFELLRQYALDFAGESMLAKAIAAIASLESSLIKLDRDLAAARARLLGSALKQVGPRATQEELVNLLNILGRLFRLAPGPKPGESGELCQLILGVVYTGNDYRARIANVITVLSASDFPIGALSAGWLMQRVPTARLVKRDRFTADLIAFACASDVSNSEALQALLTLVLPAEPSFEDWIMVARARLKNLNADAAELAGTTALASALEGLSAHMQVPLKTALLQDLPTRAISQIAQTLQACSARIAQLAARIEELQQPEAVEKAAGRLIREEISREHALSEKFQEYSRQQRAALADRLNEAFDQALTAEKKMTPQLENAIRIAVSSLRSKS